MQQERNGFPQAFLAGFFLYAGFEIALRGYTHWTMGLLGGIVMTVLYSMECRLTASRTEKALLGALFITCAEFTAGIAENVMLGWAVWDYSRLPLNVLGQVCPYFSLLWFALCIPAGLLCMKIRHLYQVA